jgi:Fic family protein
MMGNGRTARLLEKWFLAEKLGAKAWFVESETLLP